MGVPVFAVIYDMIRRFVVKGLQKHGKMELLEDLSDGHEKKIETADTDK